jgi:hypothetical protein
VAAYIGSVLIAVYMSQVTEFLKYHLNKVR